MTDWYPARWGEPAGLEAARVLLRRVSVIVPTYGTPSRPTGRDLRVLTTIGARQIDLAGMSNVNCARNTLTARWLDGDDRDWALWIDDDVWATDGPATWVEFIARALERERDKLPPIYAGGYPCKALGGGTLACVFLDPAAVVFGAGGGYHAADWIGGGAVLMHRATVDRLARELGIPGPGRVRYLYERRHYFGPQMWRNGLRQVEDLDPELGIPALEEHGEDVGLSALALAAGVPLLVDTRLRLNHRGVHDFTLEQALGPRPERAESIGLDGVRQAAEASRALDPNRLRRPA